ncbi:DUF2254 domain-containing protein [Flavobacterium algicola]|uniref:DUF2254 domain-containing protein n=1 Tax=Flavobacterium algicola TaxID=556529 RepID=UPI001EFDF406|nr:DUF2254 domain-containing protein [Flavobacterium algicola]MCG9793436.1 DUF2254 domain-containing protein [Flavobacterium algicola]
MKQTLLKYYDQFSNKLWFRPLLFCVLSVGGALIAHLVDGTGLKEFVPDIKEDSIEGLLDTISGSMLVIAIFAVGSMLSAFTSASNIATPRSFKIIIADDVSQNALSAFIGAFIFSIVATIALNNGYYGKAGRFILFLSTILLFTVVILTFLRWVDRISRLGRLEHTIKQIETEAAASLASYIKHPFLQALPIKGGFANGIPVLATTVGYVQRIDMKTLQLLALDNKLNVRLNCLPGKFVHENFPLAYISPENELNISKISEIVNKAIQIDATRLFEEDPRFGLIALTEIASRALSPGINDPGTAIQIIGSQERLLFLWNRKTENDKNIKPLYDRIEVPNITIDDLFDDAFRPICRDGASTIEVMLRLQKAFTSLATIDNNEIKEASLHYSKEAFGRAKIALTYDLDVDILKKHCLFSSSAYS